MICLCGLCVWVAYLYYVYVYVCFTSGDDNTAENFVYVLRPHNVWGADGKQEFISWLKHFRGTKEMALCFVKYICENNIYTDRQLSKNKHKKLLWSILVSHEKEFNIFFWIYKRILFVLLISLYLFIENKKKKCLHVRVWAFWWMHHVLHEQTVCVAGVRRSWIRYPLLRWSYSIWLSFFIRNR